MSFPGLPFEPPTPPGRVDPHIWGISSELGPALAPIGLGITLDVVAVLGQETDSERGNDLSGVTQLGRMLEPNSVSYISGSEHWRRPKQQNSLGRSRAGCRSGVRVPEMGLF